MNTAGILFFALIGASILATVMTVLFAVSYKEAREFERQLRREKDD